MKYYLILLKDFNILVSDESYVKGDYTIDLLDECLIEQVEVEKGNCCSFEYKIIAGIEPLPTLTYSDEIKQVLRDKYGCVDVEELASENCCNRHGLYNSEYTHAYTEGFKAHQSITDKMFSLEDMLNIYKEGYNDCFHKKGEWGTKYLIDRLQQPKMIEVEVEITDNIIKVTKLL